MIKIGLRLVDASREHLQRAAQIGVDGGTLRIGLLPGVAEHGAPDPTALRELLASFDALGLQLGGMELQRPFITGVLRGDIDRGEQELEVVTETIRILGDHGIDLVTCGFSVAHADEHEQGWRGYADKPNGRAGTLLRAFDATRLVEEDLVTWGAAEPGAEGVLVSETEVWRRLDFFMQRVLPVAREAGVRLAFHPSDPPLPLYRGVQQPFTNPDGLQRLLDRYDEPNVGLLFCLGTMQESGADMPAALRRFGEAGKLFAIHFRNVRGTVPRFEEVFQDEGDYDTVAQMRTLHEVRFDGFVMPDHYPGLLGDSEARDTARAWCVGYLRALAQATAPASTPTRVSHTSA